MSEASKDREGAAAAWALISRDTIPFAVVEDGDLVVHPEAYGKWWAENRVAILRAYDVLFR